MMTVRLVFTEGINGKAVMAFMTSCERQGICKER